jgi:hypothetical protein
MYINAQVRSCTLYISEVSVSAEYSSAVDLQGGYCGLIVTLYYFREQFTIVKLYDCEKKSVTFKKRPRNPRVHICTYKNVSIKMSQP